MSLADQTRWSKTSLREEQALLSAKASEREGGMKAEDWLKPLKETVRFSLPEVLLG